MYPEFVSRTPVVFGWGSFEGIHSLLPEGNCFLVLGMRSASDGGLRDRVEELIKGRLTVFDRVEPNPLDSTIDRGAERLEGSRSDYVLALGGGSVMDAAKAMAVVAAHGGRIVDYLTEGKEVLDAGFPVYAAPTTPGTSSEITPFSVVTVPDRRNKVGLRTPAIFPAGAIIDPSLTVSLPRRQTAATGLDILAHAFESYWSTASTPITRRFALEAVSLVRRHLIGVCRDGESREHREGISLASVFAGLSFLNTGTNICHGISYPITVDTGLPHGMACALTLGPAYSLLRGKGVDDLDDLAGSFGSDPDHLQEDLRSLLGEVGAPATLKEANFSGGSERILSTDLGPYLLKAPCGLDKADILEMIDTIS